ncbi:hypothetical protein SOCE836_040170 [Sorangium cellulosum]|uniref:Uncharacterized protein n=2 Tax=Polyangiaceae TaxID=49 RepID=A0A4P2QP22_SORCE|nr:hypothetical protein SOCE836_040170 [Sorangium cellulosum]WCQ91258.1 hypothetical protein NQZ70_03973 [Sorangium sp. Soce836]
MARMTRARDDLEALRDPALRSTPLEADSTAQSTASGPIETGPEETLQAAGAPPPGERPRAEGERPATDRPQQAGAEQPGSERAEPASSANVEPLSVEPRSRGDESLDRERYERYAMPASDLPAANVQAFRGDAGGVLAIVRRAVQSVTRDPARHRRRLPKSRFDAIRSLPELAMALDYAVARMQPESAPPAEVTERLDQLYEALRPTLAAAEACFPRGIVPETYGIVRRALVAGDPASAAATITNLILDRWNHVQGRISLTREEVTRINGTAKWLLSNTRAPERVDSRDIRDRLWSLLRERYEQLRAIAQEVSGDDSRDYAPERLAAD